MSIKVSCPLNALEVQGSLELSGLVPLRRASYVVAQPSSAPMGVSYRGGLQLVTFCQPHSHVLIALIF